MRALVEKQRRSGEPPAVGGQGGAVNRPLLEVKAERRIARCWRSRRSGEPPDGGDQSGAVNRPRWQDVRPAGLKLQQHWGRAAQRPPVAQQREVRPAGQPDAQRQRQDQRVGWPAVARRCARQFYAGNIYCCLYEGTISQKIGRLQYQKVSPFVRRRSRL